MNAQANASGAAAHNGRTRVYPLVDLGALHREVGEELEAAVLEVIRSGQLVAGPRVASFEQAFADYVGTRAAVGVANGTDALELALRALEIEPGAEVLVPANSFIASAAAVVSAGAAPRFVDVAPDSGLIDLDSCETRLSSRTRAVMVVHLYGRMADMESVLSFARRHGLAVIEDAAQAHGAERSGRRAGAFGDVGCFSFYPGKNLGAFGDAGAVVTNDPDVERRLRLLGDHGRRDQTTHDVVGRNSRLDPLHAAVLEIKLRYLDAWNARRRAAAAAYREALPAELLDGRSEDPLADVHHLFPIMSEGRDELMAGLREAGVQTGIHYPRTIPSNPAFGGSGAECPVAERRARIQLSLPMHPHLSADDAAYIAGVVGERVHAQSA